MLFKTNKVTLLDENIEYLRKKYIQWNELDEDYILGQHIDISNLINTCIDIVRLRDERDNDVDHEAFNLILNVNNSLLDERG